MSDVNAHDNRLINGLEDVWFLYQGGGPTAMQAGAEIEMAFFDPATGAPMNVAQNKAIKKSAEQSLGGDWVRNEPTADTLEAIGEPAPFANIQPIMDQLDARIAALSGEAKKHGLRRSYFQDLPDQTAADLFKNLMDIERYQAFFGPPRADMVGIAVYFAVCKSNQVSISYRDPDHMLANVRRLYALAPFLFMLTDNSSGFDQGKPLLGHHGMHHRAALGTRGGVMPYVFTAQTGEEYLRAHIQNVMNNPLYVYYDGQGVLQRLPSGTWSSMEELKKQGLNTVANYFLAQSVLWPDVKIAALRNENNDVVGHRYEARMFGVGMHQHHTALLITAALAFEENFAHKVDALLRRFGLLGASAAEELTRAYNAARNHAGQFFDISYGSGSMADFACAFADLLEGVYSGTGHERAIQPALTILRTGWTDARVSRALFPTLQDALAQQKSYDPAIFANTAQCAYDLYASRLNGQTARRQACQ
ncbi:MAG: hypothetical protein L6Q57_09885 [Alphaproteobacteria bacterium]|nr:hypothetical protein [Alphaproteobacteria bacterium]